MKPSEKLEPSPFCSFFNYFLNQIKTFDSKGNVSFFYQGKPQLYITKKMYTEAEMIAFGEKMQIVKDVDFDGNITFMYDPKNYFETNGLDGLKKSDN